MQRRVAVPVARIGVALRLKQEVHRLDRADSGGAVQRRAAAMVGDIGARSPGEQVPHFGCMARRLTGKLAQEAFVSGFGCGGPGNGEQCRRAYDACYRGAGLHGEDDICTQVQSAASLLPGVGSSQAPRHKS